MMDCSTCQSLLAEYALGQLSEAERGGVSAHLATGCPLCAAALRDAEEAWVLLVDALPPATVPDRVVVALRERIAGQRREQKLAGAPADAARLASGRAWGDPVRADRFTSDETAVNGTPRIASNFPQEFGDSTSRGRSATVRWVAAATLLLAATIGMVAWYSGREGEQPREQVGVRDRQMRQFQTELENSNLLFSGSRLHFASLHEKAQRAALHGHIVWDRLSRQVHLYAFDLPPLPPVINGRVYRVWIVADKSAPALVGELTPKANGTASAVVDVPSQIGEAFRVGVTDEPSDGLPAPTAEPWLMSEVH
jgi:hypothetical protein